MNGKIFLLVLVSFAAFTDIYAQPANDEKRQEEPEEYQYPEEEPVGEEEEGEGEDYEEEPEEDMLRFPLNLGASLLEAGDSCTNEPGSIVEWISVDGRKCKCCDYGSVECGELSRWWPFNSSNKDLCE